MINYVFCHNWRPEWKNALSDNFWQNLVFNANSYPQQNNNFDNDFQIKKPFRSSIIHDIYLIHMTLYPQCHVNADTAQPRKHSLLILPDTLPHERLTQWGWHETTHTVANWSDHVYNMRSVTLVYSCSPEPRKLCSVCVAINYTSLSMAYYAYETYS